MPDLLLATSEVDRYEGNLASMYRIRDSYGTLLYIGLTNCPLTRMKGHRWMQWYGWWQWVQTIHVDSPTGRAQAHIDELAAIHAELPLYNRLGRVPNRLGSVPAVAIEPGQVGRYQPPPGQRDRFLDVPPSGTLADFDQNWVINVYSPGSDTLLAVA